MVKKWVPVEVTEEKLKELIITCTSPNDYWQRVNTGNNEEDAPLFVNNQGVKFRINLHLLERTVQRKTAAAPLFLAMETLCEQQQVEFIPGRYITIISRTDDRVFCYKVERNFRTGEIEVVAKTLFRGISDFFFKKGQPIYEVTFNEEMETEVQIVEDTTGFKWNRRQ